MHTKFKVPNFTHFKDIIMTSKFKKGHVTWQRPFQAGTCYQQPIYQIWSRNLHPLQRYERRHKM